MPNMVVGVTTEVMAGEHKIVVAGGIDTHVHYICPQLIEEALTSGLTTLIGGGTGPNTGSNATTCTAPAEFIKMMMQATDNSPVNIGITGKGNTAHLNGIHDQIKAGVVGLKLHEDWGTTPAAIDACLTACDMYDVQVTKNCIFSSAALIVSLGLHRDTNSRTFFILIRPLFTLTP